MRRKNCQRGNDETGRGLTHTLEGYYRLLSIKSNIMLKSIRESFMLRLGS